MSDRNRLRLPNVPGDYASRKELWIRSSVWATLNQGPFITVSVQDLGYAERLILHLEERIAAIVRADGPRAERENLIMECSAHSKLWILGLYEVARIVKDADESKFALVKKLFHQLEILRMPLAKHEVKSSPNYRKAPHYPTGTWDSASGRVGWVVFDPADENMKLLTRTGIADEFLALTATEPICAPIPIGGPLGRPDPEAR